MMPLFLHSQSGEDLHISLIPQHSISVLLFLTTHSAPLQLLKRKLYFMKVEAESSCPLLSALTCPLWMLHFIWRLFTPLAFMTDTDHKPYPPPPITHMTFRENTGRGILHQLVILQPFQKSEHLSLSHILQHRRAQLEIRSLYLKSIANLTDGLVSEALNFIDLSLYINTTRVYTQCLFLNIYEQRYSSFMNCMCFTVLSCQEKNGYSSLSLTSSLTIDK